MLKKIRERLNNMNVNEFLIEIARIFKQIGSEIGKISRKLIENKFNWGYFKDHSSSFHNNFHPNNFVVIDESLGLD